VGRGREIGRAVLTLGLMAAFGLALVADADSGIYVEAVTPSRVHPGDTVHVRIGAGLRLWERIPLYVVPSDKALRPHACHRNGVCEPKVARPPIGGPYIHVATVSFRHHLRQVVSFNMPRLPAGRYEIAFYCAACYKGPGGSLIASPQLAFAVVG
jgi:hypothetical protein